MRPLFAVACALFAAGCQTQIQHGLDERTASELQTVLIERGFEAEKVLEPGKKPTWGIQVPDDRATDATRVLAELGLPRPATKGFSEVFSRGSLVPSATEERALYLQALSGELARTLEAVEGVTAARVHLVLPPPARPGTEPVPAKASAYVRVRPGRVAALAAKKPELRALIAGGVEGLTPDSVALILDEVESTVAPVAAVSTPVRRMRLLLAAMGGVVALLGVALALLAARVRQQRSTKPPAAAHAPPPRPSVATAARKIA